MSRSSLLLALGLATGCSGTGTWELSTYGEPYIEEAIPAADFADGCEATFDTFQVVLAEASVVDGSGEAVATLPSARVFDVALAGPHTVESLEVPSSHYDTARFRIAPADAIAGNVDDAVAAALVEAGDSMHTVGSLTCGADTVQFDWRFDTATRYDCEPEDLTIPGGGRDATELTVHGDHLFYDGLANDDAEVRGLAILEADANGDGEVTQAELAAVPVAPLGYQVGPYSEVEDLGAFVRHLTQTLGHVDGEGHCQVDL